MASSVGNVTIRSGEITGSLLVHIRVSKAYKARLLIGSRIMRFGAWIIGSGCEVEVLNKRVAAEMEQQIAGSRQQTAETERIYPNTLRPKEIHE